MNGNYEYTLKISVPKLFFWESSLRWHYFEISQFVGFSQTHIVLAYNGITLAKVIRSVYQDGSSVYTPLGERLKSNLTPLILSLLIRLKVMPIIDFHLSKNKLN